jgi:hypothetical protein
MVTFAVTTIVGELTTRVVEVELKTRSEPGIVVHCSEVSSQYQVGPGDVPRQPKVLYNSQEHVDGFSLKGRSHSSEQAESCWLEQQAKDNLAAFYILYIKRASRFVLHGKSFQFHRTICDISVQFSEGLSTCEGFIQPHQLRHKVPCEIIVPFAGPPPAHVYSLSFVSLAPVLHSLLRRY